MVDEEGEEEEEEEEEKEEEEDRSFLVHPLLLQAIDISLNDR